jgi:putative restriction endonuclease
MPELAPFLSLARTDAAAQWRRVQQRRPALRQEPFLPVETLLAFGLFYILKPNRYGGGNIASAPRPVHQLAAACLRTAGSFTNKMLNLDGSREHGQPGEPMLFLALVNDPGLFARLYRITLMAAREVGLGEELVPDFLQLLDRQAALSTIRPLGAQALQPAADAVARMAQGYGVSDSAAAAVLSRRAALDEHRFATAVLLAWGDTCALCGMAPRHVVASDLLVAVRLQPAPDAPPRRLFDERNGVAACPTHGHAVERLLVSFEDDGRVSLGPALRRDVAEDPGMARAFGLGCLLPRIDVAKLDSSCLRWHREAARSAEAAAH